MHYLGIDIGKFKHIACFTDHEGALLGTPLSFDSTLSGWQQLLAHVDKHIDRTDYPSVQVGFEATGHYWLTLFLKFRELGMPTVVLNPLEVKAFRNEGIRGNKTDRIDAVKIAKLLRFGFFHQAHVPNEALLGLRQLTRLKGNLVVMLAQMKQKCLTVLDQVFPEYQKHFSNVFGASSTALLSEAVTPEAIAAIPTQKLTTILRQASRGRLGRSQAETIKEQAVNTIGVGLGLDAFRLSLNILLSQIDHLQKQIDELDMDIAKRTKALGETIDTIPGIGTATAGTIAAEIGDINRFTGKDGAEKLVAFAGLDPRVRESGTWVGKPKMSKRGSPYLRHAIRQAAFVAVTVSHDPLFTRIYEKQRSRGKHQEVALSHVARKMVHVIYALLKSKKTYMPNI